MPFTWPVSSWTRKSASFHQAAHPERTSNGAHADGTLCQAPAGFTPDPTCQTTYSEGLNIGYRFFDATNETPLYPFGYGLSLHQVRLLGSAVIGPRQDGGLNVSFRVRNTRLDRRR